MIAVLARVADRLYFSGDKLMCEGRSSSCIP
jgi:hypothetical protein